MILAELYGRARWTLSARDPDAVSWLIVGAYTVAAALSAKVYLSARKRLRGMSDRSTDEARRYRIMARFWSGLVLVLVVLGVNKQLDFQTVLLRSLRRVAVEGGWYEDRRRYQVEFIALAILLAMAMAVGLLWLLREVVVRIIVAFAGAGILVAFVVIRAASFHYVDRVLSLGGRIGVNALLELSGIAAIVAGALVWLRAESAATVSVGHDVSGAHR